MHLKDSITRALTPIKSPRGLIEGFYSTETLINPVELNEYEGGL